MLGHLNAPNFIIYDVRNEIVPETLDRNLAAFR